MAFLLGVAIWENSGLRHESVNRGMDRWIQSAAAKSIEEAGV
jgi:hypothetical protein